MSRTWASKYIACSLLSWSTDPERIKTQARQRLTLAQQLTYLETKNKIPQFNVLTLWGLKGNGTLTNILLDIHPFIIVRTKPMKSNANFLEEKTKRGTNSDCVKKTASKWWWSLEKKCKEPKRLKFPIKISGMSCQKILTHQLQEVLTKGRFTQTNAEKYKNNQ